MKNLADLKRVKEGDTFKLVYSHFQPHKNMGIVRAVAKVQTNSLMFEGGSWLYFPKAKDFQPEDNGFSIIENGVLLLSYEIA